MASVVKEGVDSFLKHTLFVADDDLRGTELQQTFQAVVPVDDTAVKVVQIAGGKTAAVKLDQRTQVGRHHRENGHDHVFRTAVACHESFDQTETFSPLFAVGFVVAGFEILFQFCLFSGEVDFFQQGFDSLSTHISHKGIGIVFACLEVIIFSKGHTGFETGDITGIGNDILFVVKDTLQRLGGHVKDQTDTAGQTLEEPDM